MLGPIALLGWGSLIWDLDDLAPKVRGDWTLGAGPRLPLEFSRISPKRLGALALAIDPIHGAPCATCVIESAAADRAQAVADLAARERASIDRIGFVDAASRRGAPEICGAVDAWRRARGYAAVVWTGLEPNFEAVSGRPFAIPAAIAHLRGLGPDSLAEAHRYVTRAPETTNTPLRRALAQDPWWRALAAATPPKPSA